MKKLVTTFALLAAATAADADDDWRHMGTSGHWDFFQYFAEADNPAYNNSDLIVSCMMVAETQSGAYAGLRWGLWHMHEEPVFEFFYDVKYGESQHSFITFDNKPTIQGLGTYVTDKYAYVVISGDGQSNTEANRNSREFLGSFAGANRIDLQAYNLSLPGTRAALNSAAFNRCMGGIFTYEELIRFGQAHQVAYVDPPEPEPAPAPAPEPPSSGDFGVQLVGNSIIFTGDIDPQSVRRAASYIVNNRPDTIMLHSPGGYVGSAIKLAQVIQNFGVDTEALGDCSSACVTIFAAGKNRTLRSGARLGIHRAWTDSGKTDVATIQADTAARAEIFRKAGVDPELIFEEMSVPAQTMRWLTRDEARRYNLISN